MDTHDAIARRVTTKSFRPDPVPRYALERLLAAAVRAPNHKLTEPWRFVVVTGEAKRRLAELRREYRARKFAPGDPAGEKSVAKHYRETLETPAFVFVLCAVSDDPVRQEEDYGAVMMAIQNLLVAATADGLGTWVRTGGIMEEPGVKELAAVPAGFRIVSIVSLGYPAHAEEPKRRTSASDLTTWLS
jgi:nitroreductase